MRCHALLDAGHHREGHRTLHRWLRGRTGTGSAWVHIQWHMLVFELGIGHWQAARARFDAEIRPAVRAGGGAPTDAPAALWRLALAADGPVVLPWAEVHAAAVAGLAREANPFTTLHHLLALAGAGDHRGLSDWLAAETARRRPPALQALGMALQSCAAGDWAAAAASFEAGLPGLPDLGGSHGQNGLFRALHRRARAHAPRAVAHPSRPAYPAVARPAAA